MAISKEAAIRAAVEYVMSWIKPSDVTDQWPEIAYLPREEAVWSVPIPSSVIGVGASRVIVVSQATGAVLGGGMSGE